MTQNPTTPEVVGEAIAPKAGSGRNLTTLAERLKEAAGRATPGPWSASWDYKQVNPGDPDSYVFAHGCGPQIGSYRPSQEESYAEMMAQMTEDAAYIALANPTAILSLLEALEEAGKALEANDHAMCAVRGALADAPAMQGRQYVGLGIELNNAISRNFQMLSKIRSLSNG